MKSVIEIKLFELNGKVPYREWFNTLEVQTKAVVSARLERIKIGNFGDCKPIKGVKNIYEFRIDFGPGHRIYFIKKRGLVVILLCAGSKRSQERDIERAKKYLTLYQEGL